MAKLGKHILAALRDADGPLHGYAIKRAIEQSPDGPSYVTIASLYEAILDLLDEHEIARGGWMDVGEPGTVKLRKVYGITPAGRRALDATPA
jgi:DNA-binding PadR family transcriptional regulator